MTEPQELKIYKSIQEGLLDCAKRGIENYYSHKNDIKLEQLIWDDLIKELKERHNEQMNAVLLHPEVYKYITRKSHKKIKRRLHYDVIWWTKNNREVKYFESAKKMRKFVNYLHSWYDDVIEIEKTWCYREHTPRHKTYYVSYRPDSFVIVERY